MDILIVTHFCGLPYRQSNERFKYFASLLVDRGHQVEIVTSDFQHSSKRRKVYDESANKMGYHYTMVHEPGYRSNVSLKRLYSHSIMGKKLQRYLESRKRPELIYCAVPSLSAAAAAAQYAERNKIRFIIDVVDVWPEAFKLVLRIPVISDVLFYPIQKQADYIYSAADEIVGVSQTYADRVLLANQKCQQAHVVFLGTKLETFDQLALEHAATDKPADQIWLAYIGTLGHSYDLITVIDALKLLQRSGINNVKFIVMGDGPLRGKFEAYAKKQGVLAQFTGRLPYGQMAGILQSCDIAVNPIRRGAAQSIIYKHADYAAAGLPVLNTQESPEYRALVDKYTMGLNCANGNPQDLAINLRRLCVDSDLRRTMGTNSRRLAEERFDRGHTYPQLVQLIEQQQQVSEG